MKKWVAVLTAAVMAASMTVPAMAEGSLADKKIALIFNPVMIALIGQLMNYIHNGMDSGFESLGWGLMYLVCAMKLVGKDERV